MLCPLMRQILPVGSGSFLQNTGLLLLLEIGLSWIVNPHMVCVIRLSTESHLAHNEQNQHSNFHFYWLKFLEIPPTERIHWINPRIECKDWLKFHFQFIEMETPGGLLGCRPDYLVVTTTTSSKNLTHILPAVQLFIRTAPVSIEAKHDFLAHRVQSNGCS